MNVQSIDNSSKMQSFGSKIKLADCRLKSCLNISDRGYANNLLNTIETYHPKETILVGITHNPKKGEVIYAKNLTTGWVTPEPLLTDKNGKVDLGESFYNLIKVLLDNTLMEHNDFWQRTPGRCSQAIPDVPLAAGVHLPSNHSVFIA